MIIDLTTKVRDDLIDHWLDKQENRHIAMGHVGTHLDTYKKSSIPLEYFKRRGILVDVTSFCEEREVGLEDVSHLDIQSGDFIIFKTDRIKKTYGTKEYFFEHPELSHELIDYLIKKEVSFIGIDCPGIRRDKEHTPADILCEENQVYVIENLTNLDKINTDSFTVYTMWLDDKKATGLKCRVICEHN